MKLLFMLLAMDGTPLPLTSMGMSIMLWNVRLSCPHFPHTTRPHVYPPKMWYTMVVSCVRRSNVFSAFSPPTSLSPCTCMPSSRERMYSCESSWRPRTKCLAILLMAEVSLPMLKLDCGSDSSARRTCAWYSHSTQKPGAEHSPCGSALKYAVNRRVWCRHCRAAAAKHVLPLLVSPAGKDPRRLSCTSCQRASSLSTSA
mmetsp:Transcript_4355/g.10577  ORF Transcript_4355/g.10577 Transcript_4355/m.10577 type:complete len:200 (+) Transcript_4355:855-1454(+)